MVERKREDTETAPEGMRLLLKDSRCPPNCMEKISRLEGVSDKQRRSFKCHLGGKVSGVNTV